MYDEAIYGAMLKSWVVPTYMLCAKNLYFRDSEIKKKYSSSTEHHGVRHVHGAPEHVHCTPSMVSQDDDYYRPK